ncbi:MAG TPA: carboxypeptidase regulatory-like domain-containing protein [Blastocatellia bacterium]|nr:carboxypeptidase regulatory-like domain-containing protein [Blastocatellia bacterium]
MRKRKQYHSACALLLALLMVFSAIPAMGQAQASTGQITGSVVDTQGAAIGNATVKATNTKTGLVRSAPANERGEYLILLLPPGVYNVTGEASGFSASTVENVEVVVGRATELNFKLGAGGVQEVVNVTAGAIQVQTTRSEADAVINERAIDTLPINGRRFQDFVTLTPGAVVEPRRNQISMAGQRGINGNINVDGVDYNQPFFGGIRGGERANNAFTIPQESIKEFQVVASGYSAEFGRSTGGIVNAVTKSGTNEYHGTLLYLHRPKEAAQSNAWFDAFQESLIPNNPPAPRPSDVIPAPTQRQFGGSVGGPLKTDKAFFFLAYEQQKFENPRQVFFSLLNAFTPATTTQEAFNFYKALETPFTQTNDAKSVLGRFDYEINSNHRFNVRYSHSTNEALNANATGNALEPTTVSALSNNGTEGDRTHTVVGQLASFFTTHLVNELRAQYSREDRPRLANALQPTIETAVGRSGTVSFLPTTQFDWRFQVADSVTWTRSTHTFKFGGEFNRVFIDQKFGFNQFGRFSVSGSSASTILDIMSFTAGTGSTINRFDSTAVTYFRQIGNLQADYTTNELSFFGQDSWRIRPNLTVNFGLRWEGQYNPDPALGNDALTNLVKNSRYPSFHRPDPTQIPDDTRQWGPRVGFAYDPWGDGKTVIRGYGGVYNARTPNLLLAGPFNNFRTVPGDLSVVLPLRPALGNPNAAANTVYKQLLLVGIDLNTFTLGNLPVVPVEKIRQLATLLGIDPLTAGAAPIMMASDFRNPRSYQAGVGIERELRRGLTVGADFSYVNTIRLQRNRDVNIPLPTIRATDPAQRPFFGLRSVNSRPVPQLDSVQIRESTGRALYRALILRTKYQRSRLQFNAFYTYSKNLSDDDNERDAGGVAYENGFNLVPEYNYSNIDRTHQVVANPVVSLPFDFDAAATFRYLSGRPVDARFGTDVNEDRGGADRPFSGPGAPFVRNGFRNRPLTFVDLRVQKRIGLGEARRLILSLEMFNLLNFDNIELDGSQVLNYCSSTSQADCGFRAPTNSNFLQLYDRSPTSTRPGAVLLNNIPGAPFQMQFGARFQF